MAPPVNKDSTFPLFPRLPPELRIQIWHEALPTIGPALYFYKKGCWRLKEGDEGHSPADGDEELNLCLEFRTDLLDDTYFEIPLVFVNHEARGAALTWVRKHGIEIRCLTGRRDPIFVRGFDPACDALFVSFEKVDDFYREPEDRMSAENLFGSVVDIGPNLTRIAMSKALLRSELFTLPELFQYLKNVELLLIVVDAPPNLRHADNEMRLQRRWGFKNMPEGGFVFNLDKRRFDHEYGAYNDDDSFHRLMAEASTMLGRAFARTNRRNFEVRPVSVIRI